MEIVSPFDMVSVGLILFSGAFAYLRGFVKEILLILNWILAIVVAYLISPPIFRNISEINFMGKQLLVYINHNSSFYLTALNFLP